MKKFVNINEGHTGSLLNQGQDRRDRGGKKTHMVLSDNKMCFVHLSRLCLNLSDTENVLYPFVPVEFVFKC